ncbi:MAG: hypothetical protein R2879_00295 [Saprospiraceae bacterium]
MLRYLLFFVGLFLLVSCDTQVEKNAEDLGSKSWEAIEASAKGKEFTFMMWQGDPLINSYVRDYVKPAIEGKVRYHHEYRGRTRATKLSAH